MLWSTSTPLRAARTGSSVCSPRTHCTRSRACTGTVTAGRSSPQGPSPAPAASRLMNAVKRVPSGASASRARTSSRAAISIPPVSPGTRKIRFSPTCIAAVRLASGQLERSPPHPPPPPPAAMSGGRGLTIGIDARAAVEVPAGRGRVVRELLLALAARTGDRHRYVLYAREAWERAELDERFRWRTIPSADPWWHLRAARAANRECDVFLSSNSYLTVWFLHIPAVAIVHDLTTFEPSMRPSRRSTVIERLTLGPAVRRAAAFIAVSQATADALAAHFP